MAEPTYADATLEQLRKMPAPPLLNMRDGCMWLLAHYTAPLLYNEPPKQTGSGPGFHCRRSRG